jgi:hypothetical protein
MSKEAVYKHLWGAKTPDKAIQLAQQPRFRHFGEDHPIVKAGHLEWGQSYCDAAQVNPELLGWARANECPWSDALRNNVKVIVVPEGVTHIGKCAFSRCTSLTAVSLPAGLTHIGAGAFSNCSTLNAVKLPDSLTSIGSSTFLMCRRLPKITLSPHITEISRRTFEDCTFLAEVLLPAGLAKIGAGAFERCRRLQRVALPDSLRELDDSAFRMCSALAEVKLPAGLRDIVDQVFLTCHETIFMEKDVMFFYKPGCHKLFAYSTSCQITSSVRPR